MTIISNMDEQTPALPAVYFDKEDPEALYNLLPPVLQGHIDNLPSELLVCPEHELHPNALDEILRISFWSEYERAMLDGRNMNISEIMRGVCARGTFYSLVITDPKRLAYLLRMPPSYKTKLEGLLDIGIDRLREILQQPFTGDKKSSIMSVVLDTVKFIDTRVKGAVVQRLETKNLNVDIKGTMNPKTAEEIFDRIENIKQTLIEAKKVPDVPTEE